MVRDLPDRLRSMAPYLQQPSNFVTIDVDETYDYSHTDFGRANITFSDQSNEPLIVLSNISLDLLLFKNMAGNDYRQYDLEF